ncbi:MAG: helix-turn-helix domain-containing protein [Clostridiales bacterium]|jgi:transcriptional regulator with XRE-family HTH domain|nr:helix-turn-helix domain-containing protein [Clostridiales bacterium]
MVSDYIREIRQMHGHSQGSLAKALGVSQKTISNWETDSDNPSAYNLIAIYEKFNITPNEILGIESARDSVAPSAAAIPRLPEPQQKILALFRRMDLRRQAEFLNFAEFLLEKSRGN